MRDQIVDGQGPGLDLELDPEGRATRKLSPETEKEQPEGKKKRNNKLGPINYFKALDDILADSYTKQEAAVNISIAFSDMMESRGIATGFENEKFERAASNMAVVSMMREMAWLFGLGPELADRIAEHTVDKLFAPGHARKPEVKKG